MMRLLKKFVILCSIICLSGIATAQTVTINYPQIPILTDSKANVVAEITIDCQQPAELKNICFSLSTSLSTESIMAVELYSSGAMSPLVSHSESQAVKDVYKRLGGSQAVFRDSDYSTLIASVSNPDCGNKELRFDVGQPLKKGKNVFFVSLSIDVNNVDELSKTILLNVRTIAFCDGTDVNLPQNTITQRLGVAVRQSGDDGVYAYRIPGLVTTPQGTLIAVYDVRHNTSIDLQENIDIGMSRSIDGGLTWSPMQIIMDMGSWGGLPEAQNGIGDPSVVVDDATGEIFVVASWVHGLGNRRAWGNVGSGLTPEETAQIMLVSSTDDGKTWSAPRNLTNQIKQPEWTFTLQGPGRGITASDGTLVVPIQYISDGTPSAAIMYSIDHGKSWQTHVSAKSNTTESQVAELSDGRLMLNMRDNRRTGRAVATTDDLGRSWREHPSSGRLIEPLCMASLLSVAPDKNITGRHLLLFSNPNDKSKRQNISIKASFDDGMTWLPEQSLLLDEEPCWGYSCLAMIDSETVGILYESSRAQILFQAVALNDIIGNLLPSSMVLEETARADFDEVFGRSSELGLSGHFCFTCGDGIVVGGGCNFPDKSAAEGGEKQFYKTIYLLDSQGKWLSCGELPAGLAYAAVAEIDNGLIVCGGNNECGLSDRVWRLDSGKNGNISIKELARLPQPLEQASAAVVGNKIYVFGGRTATGASNKVLCLSLNSKRERWHECGVLPQPLIQSTAAAVGSTVYVFGGYNDTTDKITSPQEAYAFSVRTKQFRSIAQPSAETIFVGSSAVALSNRFVVLVGGVDRKIFIDAINRNRRLINATDEDSRKKLTAETLTYMNMPIEDYMFSHTIFLYDTVNDSWSIYDTAAEYALAGAAITINKNQLYITGGELKPGIRTPQVLIKTIKQ